MGAYLAPGQRSRCRCPSDTRQSPLRPRYSWNGPPSASRGVPAGAWANVRPGLKGGRISLNTPLGAGAHGLAPSQERGQSSPTGHARWSRVAAAGSLVLVGDNGYAVLDHTGASTSSDWRPRTPRLPWGCRPASPLLLTATNSPPRPQSGTARANPRCALEGRSRPRPCCAPSETRRRSWNGSCCAGTGFVPIFARPPVQHQLIVGHATARPPHDPA